MHPFPGYVVFNSEEVPELSSVKPNTCDNLEKEIVL